jgi:hypothetical protein
MSFDGWMAEQESGRRREVRTVMGEGNEVVRRTLGPILPELFFVSHENQPITAYLKNGPMPSKRGGGTLCRLIMINQII